VHWHTAPKLLFLFTEMADREPPNRKMSHNTKPKRMGTEVTGTWL